MCFNDTADSCIIQRRTVFEEDIQAQRAYKLTLLPSERDHVPAYLKGWVDFHGGEERIFCHATFDR